MTILRNKGHIEKQGELLDKIDLINPKITSNTYTDCITHWL